MNALKGEKMSETKAIERLLDKTVKLYNKAIAQKGKSKTNSAKGVDKTQETRYSKRTTYNQYRSLAMQWANANTTKVGDVKILYDAYAGTFKLIESTKVDEGYIELKSGSYEELEACLEDARESKKENYIVHEDIARYEDVGGGNAWDMLHADEGRGDGRVGGVYQGESDRNATRDYERSGSDSQTKPLNDDEVRYSRRVKERNNERSDEFRRIQEESLAMSDGELQRYRNGSKKMSDDLFRRLSRVYREEIHTGRSRAGNRYGVLNNTGDFAVYKGVDADLFHDIFEVNRRYLQNGELVDLHDVETTEDGIGYEDCTNYLADDGLSGFSVTPDGDLISVFNMGRRRGFLHAMAGEVKSVAKTLDCYNSKNQPLAGMYTKHFGFKVASVMDYNMEYDHDNIAKNHAKPKVCFMVNTEQNVQQRQFTENQYDEAVAYQQSFVRQNDDGEIRRSRRVNGYKYLPRSRAEITEQEYNHHAWATANDILSQNESGSFIKKIGEKKSGTQFSQTADGLYMIPVGEKGIENKIVFTDGDYDSPSVVKVVEIKANNETFLSEIKELIYEYGRYGLQVKTAELFKVYDYTNYEYAAWSEERRRRVQDNAQRSGEQYGRRTPEEIRRSRRVRFSQEELGAAVDETLQILSIVNDIDEDTFDVSVKGKNKILSDFVAKINEQAA